MKRKVYYEYINVPHRYINLERNFNAKMKLLQDVTYEVLEGPKDSTVLGTLLWTPEEFVSQ